MADTPGGENIGGINVSIGADYSQLQTDFQAAQSDAQKAGDAIAGAFNDTAATGVDALTQALSAMTDALGSLGDQVDGLSGAMCKYTDDTRVADFIGGGLGTGEGLFGKRMAQYLKLADDNANRAQSVQLDRRLWGASFSKLRNSKKVGW